MKKRIACSQLTNELIGLIEKNLPDTIRKVDDNIIFKNPQFNALLENAPSMVFILNHQTMLYEYFSRNVRSILGYDPERYQKEGVAFSSSTFDPDHFAIHVKKIYPDVFAYFSKYPNEQEELRFTTSFKVKKADGCYIWAMQQIHAIKMDDSGMPFLTLTFMQDVTSVKKDELVDFVIAKKNSEGVYCPIYSASYLNLEESKFFSQRELEILNLLGKGMSTAEIAGKLFISEHTVSTHRKNMLKKSESKNSTELLNFSFAKGLIAVI